MSMSKYYAILVRVVVMCGLISNTACVCSAGETNAQIVSPGAIVLVDHGRPNAAIVISDNPMGLFESYVIKTNEPKTVLDAARELQKYIELSSGARLPIVTESESPTAGNLILVGRSGLTEKYGISPPTEREGFTIRTFPRGVAIVGETIPIEIGGSAHEVDRGTSNAIYHFLDKFLGFRFYFQSQYSLDHNDLGVNLPLSQTLSVPGRIDYTDSPVFSQRVVYVWWRWQPAMRGGRGNGFTCNHTQSTWRNRYKDSHPEYFRVKEDGTEDWGQLCYSQPGVLERYLELWDKYFETGIWEGDWLAPNFKYVYLEPTDNYKTCHCKNCTQQLRRTKNILEEHSDLWWGFVKRAALEVKKRWPDRRIATLAYARHFVPPSFDLPDNVDVMVATHWPRPYVGKQPGNHQKNMKAIKEWSTYVNSDRNRLYLFDYYCYADNGTGAPVYFPFYEKRFLTELRNTMSGSFVCGGNLGANSLPRDLFMVYMYSKLLWNPEINIRQEIDTFCKDFFGPASEPMKQFYMLLVDRYENVIWKDRPEHVFTLRDIYSDTYPRRVIERLSQYLAEARALVDADIERHYKLKMGSALLLTNASQAPRVYFVRLSPVESELVNPKISWGSGSITYQGSVYPGQQLVVSQDSHAQILPNRLVPAEEMLITSIDSPIKSSDSRMIFTAWVSAAHRNVNPGEKFRIEVTGKAAEGGNSEILVLWDRGKTTTALANKFTAQLGTASEVITVPEDVSRMERLILCRRNNVGTVWYESVSVKREPDKAPSELPNQGIDVSERIEGTLPELDAGESKLISIMAENLARNASAEIILTAENADCRRPYGTDIYSRRVAWIAGSFEACQPVRNIYEKAIDGFLAIAWSTQNWMDIIPEYHVRQVQRETAKDFNDEVWEKAPTEYLVSGRPEGIIEEAYGFYADVKTTIQMLQDDANLYVAFYCQQPEPAGDKDSVTLSFTLDESRLLVVTVSPQGDLDFKGTNTENNVAEDQQLKAQAADGLSTKASQEKDTMIGSSIINAYTGIGQGYWRGVVVIPKKELLREDNKTAIEAQFYRKRGWKNYVWSPSLRAAWALAPSDHPRREGRIWFK